MFSLNVPKKHDTTHLKLRISSIEHHFQWDRFPTRNASNRSQTSSRNLLTSIFNTSTIQTRKNQPKVHQEAPNLSQKLSKSVPKPLQILSWGRFFSMELILNFKCVVKAPKNDAQSGSRDARMPPNLSQTPPKPLPKPIQNRLKNVCEKYMV